MKIIKLSENNNNTIRQAAELLVEGFKEHWPGAWPDMEAATREVRESLNPDRINRIAIDDGGSMLGWVGASRQYHGNTWELHPLVVHKEQRGKGIGRALVLDREKQVRDHGGMTIYLGSDDENQRTSLAGIDLYPDVVKHISRIKNFRGHPYEFYQKLEYVIVGVIPDANGPGKPDILMAKRLILE